MLFVINGQEGINPVDQQMAKQLRQWNKPVILLINKADSRASEQTALDSFALGLGTPILISAAHNMGFIDLQEALEPFMDVAVEDDIDGSEEAFFEDEITDEEAEAPIDPTIPIKIAIVGRPNVGKSTLLNAIIGEERAITSPIAGTTRDTVAVQWTYHDRYFRLVDTAGLRKRYKIVDKLEKLSAFETERAIRLAHVVVLVMEANATLDHQDQAIADHVIKEGRALVIAVNKWDTVENSGEFIKEFRDRLNHSISQVKEVPYVTMSAIKEKGIDKLMETIIKTYNIWQKRLSTGKLNRWLEGVEGHNPPPMVNGRSNRMRYITQIKSKPPTFALWTSRPDDLPDSYQRYLVNQLRETFDLPGIPLRLQLKTTKNPYHDKDAPKKH
jgi:GTP-binding protein